MPAVIEDAPELCPVCLTRPVNEGEYGGCWGCGDPVTCEPCALAGMGRMCEACWHFAERED